ncbi:hypothetical protein LJC23_02850 [Desulfovibrio sp. OttesenSCG-928-I05]|nr:hypothetical protein [Desulfovibrio sp. OttesenSCG-928-I05]
MKLEDFFHTIMDTHPEIVFAVCSNNLPTVRRTNFYYCAGEKKIFFVLPVQDTAVEILKQNSNIAIMTIHPTETRGIASTGTATKKENDFSKIIGNFVSKFPEMTLFMDTPITGLALYQVALKSITIKMS